MSEEELKIEFILTIVEILIGLVALIGIYKMSKK